MAAPRGRDSPEAAGAERGSRTLGSRRDSAPGGGGVGEGWGGGPALTREPGNAHCACAPPAGQPPAPGCACAMLRGREDALRLRGRREGGMEECGVRARRARASHKGGGWAGGACAVRGWRSHVVPGCWAWESVVCAGLRRCARGSDGSCCASGAAVEELLLSVLSHAGLGRCSPEGCKAGAAVC